MFADAARVLSSARACHFGPPLCAHGDRVTVRLVNEAVSDHPMHHPFHIPGAGRFLVLSRDGAPEENLVWKDTVLVRAGQTLDLLLDLTHPGLWMAHCHIPSTCTPA